MAIGYHPNLSLQVRSFILIASSLVQVHVTTAVIAVAQVLSNSMTFSMDGTWFKSSSETAAAMKTSQPSLKRSRSSISIMDLLPSIPRLSGDIILQVYTHRSLRFVGAPDNDDSEYGDNDRLALLGEKAFEIAVTDALFRKRPMLKADDLEHQRSEWASSNVIENWVTGYRLRDKLRFSQDAMVSIREPQETIHLFYAYVGAVYAQHGVKTVLNWIGTLVDPDFEPSSPQDATMDQSFSFLKLKVEPQFMQQSYDPQQFTPDIPQFAPPPPSNPPPPLPQNLLNPAQSQTAFLPLFNQTASQRRVGVDYPAVFSGPAHAGSWTVRCVVNGIEKGMGTGTSKQLAKEEAAKQAYYAMGWALRTD